MTLLIEPEVTERVPLKQSAQGVVLVEGTRIPLDIVSEAFNAGKSPEEIVLSYPTLGLADENVHGEITRGVLRRQPNLDIVRVQDIDLAGADDPTVLAQAAAEGRVVPTSDVSTLVGYAYERVRSGHAVPGVFVIRQDASLGRTIEDIVLLAEASLEGKWEGQVRYLPL
ncbi:MAG: DUF5615 family PIN-like protein [Chloroflexi bacterium]|nr:DUF5615 family PIN-like protein [Chloroflexota bacterium]